jgi:hypothetical protein
MSASLSQAVVLYAVAVGLICAGAALLGRLRPRPVGAGLVLLEVAVLGQALLDGAALLRGQHGSAVVTNVGYLLTSAAVLPIVASAVRLDPGRWGSAALAVGCLVLAVVSVRLHQTLGTADG